MHISENINKMKTGIIKIIECFNITGIGLLTEIQHNENGISPKTKIRDLNLGDIWIINKRVVSNILLIENTEILFDCETKIEHISHSFKTMKDRKVAVLKEIEKRKNGIYWYLISPIVKKGKLKPEINSVFKIVE